MNTGKLNDKEFVEYCKNARRKGVTPEQLGYAELLMKACSRLTAAEEALEKAEEELKDVRLELSTPSTAGIQKEPLYKWAALIVCEGHQYRRKLKRAEAEIKRITEIANRRSCDSCCQIHDIGVMCPPHEVRIKGDCWYHKTIKRLQDDLEKYRWIPVAERLPKHKYEDEGDYLVCGTNAAWIERWTMLSGDEGDGDNYGWQNNSKVITHWKPNALILPKE